MASAELQMLGVMAKEAARQIGRKFTHPDDDWTPAMILQRADDSTELVGVDPTFTATHEGMDRLVGMLQAQIRSFGAVRLALVVSTWQAAIDKNATPEQEQLMERLRRERRLEDWPGRKEILMLELADRQSFEIWQAEITRRRARPPLLGAWKLSEGFDSVQGRMIEPLIHALRPQG